MGYPIMDKLCPECQNAITYLSGDRFKCEHCDKDYLQQACCPDCDNILEKLQGCGATDYFCRNGHGLISKKRIIWKVVAE